MKRLLTLILLCAAVCSASTTYINRISQVLSLTGAQTNMVEWNVPYTPDAVVLTCTSGSVRVWAARAHNIVRIAGVATTNDSGAWLDTGASAKWCPDGYGTCWLASTGASAVVTLDVIGKRGDSGEEIQAAMSGYATKGYADSVTNASVISTPSNYIAGAIGLGEGVNIPTGKGAINAGTNCGILITSGVGALNIGGNEGKRTASGNGSANIGFTRYDGTNVASQDGAMNIGFNRGDAQATGHGSMNIGAKSGITLASGVGALNIGHNDDNVGSMPGHGTQIASGNGALNIGNNDGIQISSGHGAINIGQNSSGSGKQYAQNAGAMNIGANYAQQVASGVGSINIGYLSPSTAWVTNSGNGSVALLDSSGNMFVTNDAAIVLGNGYSAGNRTLVADAVVIRSMGSRVTDAATKYYVDLVTNADDVIKTSTISSKKTGTITQFRVGTVPWPIGAGAINIGYDPGNRMTNNAYGGINICYVEGAARIDNEVRASINIGGVNGGRMSARQMGAMNLGAVDGTMHAEYVASVNIGWVQGSAVMYNSGAGAVNIGYLSGANYVSNTGYGSLTLADNSGNIIMSNKAAIVLGSGGSRGDRSVLADKLVAKQKLSVEGTIDASVMVGILTMTSNRISQVGEPISSMDAATKLYCDTSTNNIMTLVWYTALTNKLKLNGF